MHISVPLILYDFQFLNLPNKGYRTVCKFFCPPKLSSNSFEIYASFLVKSFYWVFDVWFSSWRRIGVRGPIKPQLFSYQKFSFKVLLIPFLYKIIMKAKIRIRQSLVEQTLVMVWNRGDLLENI